MCDGAEELRRRRYSLLAGELEEFPGLMLPQSGFVRGIEGVYELEAPPGELRMVLQDEFGARAVYAAVSDEPDVVVELEPPFEVVVESPEHPFAPGWLLDISFQRDGVAVPERDVFMQAGGSDPRPRRQARVVVGGEHPDALYIPPLPEEPTWFGEWMDVPEGAHKVLVQVGTGLDFQ